MSKAALPLLMTAARFAVVAVTTLWGLYWLGIGPLLMVLKPHWANPAEWPFVPVMSLRGTMFLVLAWALAFWRKRLLTIAAICLIPLSLTDFVRDLPYLKSAATSAVIFMTCLTPLLLATGAGALFWRLPGRPSV